MICGLRCRGDVVVFMWELVLIKSPRKRDNRSSVVVRGPIVNGVLEKMLTVCSSALAPPASTTCSVSLLEGCSPTFVISISSSL